eukprot:2686067-Prymnesium_polylepis.1
MGPSRASCPKSHGRAAYLYCGSRFRIVASDATSVAVRHRCADEGLSSMRGAYSAPTSESWEDAFGA